MWDKWGFGAIRNIGHTDLSLNPPSDSRICYIARTNHLKATRSAEGTTFVDAWIRRPIGTIEVAGGPDKTIATMVLTDPRIKLQVTARTKSSPSVAVSHSFEKPLCGFSFFSEETVHSNPFQIQLKLACLRRIKECNYYGKLAVDFLSPMFVFFADHEFMQSKLSVNLKNQKIALSFGDPTAFFCCSISRLKPVKIGGFASSDFGSIGARATARKTLRLIGNFNGNGLSLSCLYDRTPLNQSLTIAGRAPVKGTDLACKYEVPDLITFSVAVGKKIRITLAGVVRIGGECLTETVRYGLDASFIGDD
jgi:hypothetical protein